MMIRVLRLSGNCEKLCTISSCLLSPFPANGSYISSSVMRVPRPGDEVRRPSALDYSCNPGYFLTEEVAVCKGKNTWSTKPACKICRLGSGGRGKDSDELRALHVPIIDNLACRIE